MNCAKQNITNVKTCTPRMSLCRLLAVDTLLLLLTCSLISKNWGLNLGWTNILVCRHFSGVGVYLWAYIHFNTLVLVLAFHNGLDTHFAVCSFSAELLMSAFKNQNWSKPEFKSASLSFSQKCCTASEEVGNELLNDLLALCLCALLCTKRILNAFSIHWRAIKSFHHVWVTECSGGLTDFITHLKW